MAGTHSGKSYGIYPTAVTGADLVKATVEGYSYTAIGPTVGQFPAYGVNRALATYNGHSKKLKGFGAIDYGGGPMQVPHDDTDAGQVVLRALNKDEYHVIEVDHNDETGSGVGDYTATKDYLLCKISGPHYPEGGDEDFKIEEYQIGIEDVLRVLPAEITA